MADNKYLPALQKPFRSPWFFFILTLLFCVSSLYFIRLYSTVHWGVIAKSDMASVNARIVFRGMLNDVLEEKTIEAFREKCEKKYWSDNLEEFARYVVLLDDKRLKEVRLMCEFYYWNDRARDSAFDLLSKTAIYSVFGLLSFISSIACMWVSIKHRPRWVGVLALILGLIGIYIGMVMM